MRQKAEERERYPRQMNNQKGLEKEKMHTVNGKKIENICIIGAGNIGHYLMALIGQNEDVNVLVLTSDASGFTGTVESTNVNNGEVTTGHVKLASTDPAEVIPVSDMIIFTTPSNAYRMYLDKIYPYTKEGTLLGFIPGSGGVEFLARDFVLKKHCCLFGAQRVPSGTKVIVRGQKVNSLGNRKDMRFAAIPGRITPDICRIFKELIGIDTIEEPNYLSVTLTPSNPILHTSRLYGLFHDYHEGMTWDEHLAFYKNWDELSAEVLIGCDAEEQACMKKMNAFDLTGVKSLIEHYEIAGMPGENDIQKMTNKLRVLPFLKDYAPMVETEEGKFIPALGSRYFHEDFPYGLCIIRSFCEVTGTPSPTIDRILHWYCDLMGTKYYDENGAFAGEDLASLPLPQNEGIHTAQDVKAYYDRLEEAAGI